VFLVTVLAVMEAGRKVCGTCNGDGKISTQNYCTHRYWDAHHHCSSHGNNVAQYH